jgi:hypothetical protein
MAKRMTISRPKKVRHFIKFLTHTSVGKPISVELPLKKDADYKDAEQYCEDNKESCTLGGYSDFYNQRKLMSTDNVVKYYWAEPYLPEELKEFTIIPTNSLVRYDRKKGVIYVACSQ